jgi:glycosyltransferase involved in cell wall biosynthesis
VKVLYVSPYPPSRDGIGDYTWTLAHAVRNTGAEISVLVPRYGRGSPPEVIGELSAMGQRYAEVRSAIRQWRPDLVHLQFAVAAFESRTPALMRWLTALRRDLKLPVIATLHEYTRESALLPVVGPALHAYIASRCDRVIVHTSTALNDVTVRLGVPVDKVSLIPHPTCLPPAATSSPDDLRARFGLGDARILLAFGFIHVDKGLDDLVRALSILGRTQAGAPEDVRLVVAGAVRSRRGLFRPFEVRDRIHLLRVISFARRHGLADRLVLTGYVPAGDVATWFNLAEAVVLPYRRIEQSGVASMALALDAPVLASAVGGLAEQFADSQWSFPPRAPARLAETLERFLATSRSAQSQAASLRRTDDDLTSVVARTLELYHAVISRSQGKDFQAAQNERSHRFTSRAEGPADASAP